MTVEMTLEPINTTISSQKVFSAALEIQSEDT